MSIKIAINGYGRIGRNLHRQLLKKDGFDVVAINSRADANSHAHLLKYDSLYGKCDADIHVEGDHLRIDGDRVAVYQIKEPEDLDWSKEGIDIVIESTGRFTTREDAHKHINAGAKKVLITAPCKDETVPNIVMGVNDDVCLNGDYDVVSNASCTTNCLAPMLHVLNKEFGVKNALVSTLHAFTYTQNLLDNSNMDDYRRARATTESIIPTTTGAMKAIGRVIPELSGKVEGMAFRVPVPTVSVVDLTANLERIVSVEDVNNAFKKYEVGSLSGYLGTTDEPLVSVDFRGDHRSSIIDLLSTKALSNGTVKVIGWYDNEWGYVSRVVDLISLLSKSL